MPVIEILGTGCSDCLRLALVAAEAADMAGIAAEIHQVTDPHRIEAYGVLEPPGLAIDGYLASTGRVPTSAEIAVWLRDTDRWEHDTDHTPAAPVKETVTA